MIHGYFPATSVTRGDTCTLHVSATSDRFRVELLLLRDTLVPLGTIECASRGHAAPGSARDDWAWPGYQVGLDATWPAGIYIVRLREGTASVQEDQLPHEMLLVVRDPAPQAAILYKIPIATYQAYNMLGGGNLYEPPANAEAPRGRVVTLHRPGGGLGGDVRCATDVYQTTSRRNTFDHWDAPFVRWLSSHGYAVDFCTNLDLHLHATLLDGYSLLVVGGHDEYWSARERHAVERFRARGGNIAIFGGNTCWWRVDYSDDGSQMFCNKGDWGVATDQWWPTEGAGAPEDSLTGVSYRHGGGWWDGLRQPLGYTVQEPRHWAFEGADLAGDACFGAGTCPPLIGYECDGAPVTRGDNGRRFVLDPEARMFGTPESTQILATAELSGSWQDLPARERHDAHEGIHAATMIATEAPGVIFNAATTDWSLVLASGTCAAVDTITHRVLRRLSGPR